MVGRISYNMYFDCKRVRYVACDLINEYTQRFGYGFDKYFVSTNVSVGHNGKSEAYGEFSQPVRPFGEATGSY